MLLLFATCTEKKETTGSINGFVTDADSGEPLRAVNLTLNPIGLSAVSGSDGRYEFVDLEEGYYTVMATKSGYQTNYKSVLVTGGKTASGDMMLTPSFSQLELNRQQIDFGQNGNVQVFQIFNTGSGGTASWTITKMSTANWLTVSPTSGTTAADQHTAVTLTADRSLLTGPASVNLRITNTTNGNELTLPVSIDYVAGGVTVTPAAIDFGTSGTTQSFQINNTSSNSTYAWTVSKMSTADWLSITPQQGSTTAGGHSTVTLTVNRSLVTQSANVNLRILNTTTNTETILPVSISHSQGVLNVSPTTIDFGSTSDSRTLTINNTGSASTSYTIGYNCSWLNVSPTSGTLNAGGSQTVSLSLNRQNLTESSSTTLTVTNTADGSSITITVIASVNGGGGGGNTPVVTTGLLAYYTFDNGNANDWTDNAAHASLMNNASTVSDGTGGYYLSISSVQAGFMNIPYNFFNGRTHWTVSFWIKDLTAGNVFSAQNTSHETYYDVPRLWAKDDGLLKIECSGYVDGITPISYNYSINSSIWHFYTIVMDGMHNSYQANIKFYVDGVLIDNVTPRFDLSTVNSNSKIQIGGDKNGDYSVAPSMKLDNLRFYSRSLSNAEIQTIYNAEQ